MSNDPDVEQHQQPVPRHERLSPSEATDNPAHDHTRFTDHGAKPPVVVAAVDHQPTASDRAFGVHKHHKAAAHKKPPTDQDWSTAQRTLQAAADIVQHERGRMIAEAPPAYVPILWQLHAAVTGHRNGAVVSGSDRLELLESARAGLAPAIEMYQTSEEGRGWLHDELLGRLAQLHEDARFTEAKDRVDKSVRIGTNEIVELPDEDHPREQGRVLHAELQKLIPTIAMINEQVIRMAHDGIHHEAEAMMEAHAHGGKKFGPGSLVELQNLLFIADGFLTLTDKEFQHHLNHIQGFFNGVATYTELVKAATEITGGAIGMTASYAAVIAKLAGDSNAVTMASGLARASGLIFANVIAGIEIVHGIAVLLDPHATPQEKLDGAVGASSGAAWFIGSRVAGAAAGFAASSAILIGYAELKLMAHLYWEANIGITSGFMRMAYETIQRDGNAIATGADDLAKCGLLIQDEKDPEKLAALERVQTVLAKRLGDSVDYFIDDCQPHGYEAGVARYPGAYTIFRETFAPVMKHKGAQTPEAASQAATVALERITWSMAHAGDLIVASAKQQHLSDVEHDLAKKQEHHGEE